MSTWEVEDNRIIPSDLVREQDFILFIRRMNRVGAQNSILNLSLSAVDKGGRGLLEEVQARLKAWVKSRSITISEMSNGDVFLVRAGCSTPQEWAEQAFYVAWPDGMPEQNRAEVFRFYVLPTDYLALRERLNTYIEVSRQATLTQSDAAASRLLQTEAARGPLSIWGVDQIDRLLDEIDIHKYLRFQHVCQRQPTGKWTSLYEECFVGFEELRAERFPKIEAVPSPSHLFMSLCEALDRHLFDFFAEHLDIVAGRRLFFNLSVGSIVGSGFARFAHNILPQDRKLVGFELHRGDLFQNLGMTLNTISLLQREGFSVIIDGVSPHVLPYIDFSLFNVDFIKINVSKERVPQLQIPSVQKAFLALPSERVIFYHCDTEAALQTGLAFGVSRFQGWLVDSYLKASL